ncbi:putative amino acid permease YhdG [Shimia sp. SK013]|uniref:APC family permease n=1 Tax=Shimia sp. SK013 TaxID=1389006 RepID=UPI0006B61AA1|nr:amino acid permease [Shimia sp. SK013]KPA23156.1 putative amino acid permease YhdG [Shimia sp. SK013]
MSEHLKRSVGLGLLTAYGVGVMVGAGIYVLVGAVAGEAGIYAPLAFLLAGLVAAPTALSYGELSARIPEAAGEAAFVEKAFGSQVLAVLVGLAIVATGVVSAAAVLRGGAGYLLTLVSLPQVVAIVGLAVLLVGVALYGVMESLALAAVFTVIELAGLGLVVWAGSQAPVTADWAMAESTSFVDLPWGAIGAAAVLAFFAFIGFEDIVNMAEETQRPERNVPWAIILSLGITTVVYALVTWVTVRVVPIGDLAESERPLVLVLQSQDGASSGRILAAIAVFAALNGVLAQIVMASRVLFGLGRRTKFLAMFHQVHPRRGTPYVATLVIGGLVIVAAMSANVSALAQITSLILLSAFVVMNAALIVLKLRSPEAPFRVHMAVPVSGMLLALGALGLYLGVLG